MIIASGNRFYAPVNFLGTTLYRCTNDRKDSRLRAPNFYSLLLTNFLGIRGTQRNYGNPWPVRREVSSWGFLYEFLSHSSYVNGRYYGALSIAVKLS